MKPIPFKLTIALACTALLVSCSPRQSDNADLEKQNQDRLAEEHQAQEERALHEREAALDERQRQLDEREKQLGSAAPASARLQGQAATGPAAATPTPAYSVDTTYQTFYDNLTPYGTWVQLAGYGYVWQPQAAHDPAWRPYTLGRWAFTDQGWTWVSDEPFGWITYHYGRWMRTTSLNWVWFPGDQWAPAWVSWRFGGDFAGWAPLPPEARLTAADGIKQWADDAYNLTAGDYTFVPASEFGDDSMASAAVPQDQNVPIYDDSNNITNIYYDTGGYAVFCYGPSFDYLRVKVHRPLLPYLAIRRAAFRADGKNGSAISGNTFQITAPHIFQSRTPVAPKVIRGRVDEPRLITPASVTGADDVTLTPRLGAAQDTNGNPPAAPARNVAADQSAGGMRIPSRMVPVDVPQQIQEQKARDLQIIEASQAAARQRDQVDNAQASATLEAARFAEQQRAAQAQAGARGDRSQGSTAQVIRVAPVQSAGTQQQSGSQQGNQTGQTRGQ
jgi:hypothetical protein